MNELYVWDLSREADTFGLFEKGRVERTWLASVYRNILFGPKGQECKGRDKRGDSKTTKER